MSERKRKKPDAGGKKPRVRKAASTDQHVNGSTHQHTNGAASVHRVKHTKFADVADKDLEPLWRGRLTIGELTIMTGDSEAGKGMLAADLCRAITNGKAMPGGPDVFPGQVLYYATEDDAAAVVKKRLQASGANLDLITTMLAEDLGGNHPSSLLSGMEKVALSMRCPAVRLIVLDTVSDFLPPGLSPMDESAVRPFLQELARLARLLELAMLLVRHPRKDQHGSDLAAIAGAAAWGQVPRHAVKIRERPGEAFDRVLIPIKNSTGPKPLPLTFRIEDHPPAARVVWGADSTMSAEELKEDLGTPSERSALQDAMRAMRAILGTEPMESAAFIAACDRADIGRTYRVKAKKLLGVRSFARPGSSPVAWMVAPPEGGFPE